MQLLTKSLFKLGMECKTKLFYKTNSTYENTKLEDTFLQSLAEGGFQVQALAQLYYNEGIHIQKNIEEALLQTKKLMRNKNSTLFEGAFQFENLLIRTDIIQKSNNKIDLIEIKAKSYDPNNAFTFEGKKGGLVSGWKPYLYDLAFQKYVLQKCYPDYKIKSFFFLCDKSERTSVDGLNQLFRVVKNESGIFDLNIKRNTTASDLGNPILSKIDISDIIEDILNDKYGENFEFEELILEFKSVINTNQKIESRISSACKKCEFKKTENSILQCGFTECFKSKLNWKDEDFKDPLLFSIDSLQTEKFIVEGKIKVKDLEYEDVHLKIEPNKISASQRKLIQINKIKDKDQTPYFLKDKIKQIIKSWKFPLNFIDFETSRMAIPNTKGLRPYEQIAFQFSHHVVFEDGKIDHQAEYICEEAGKFPNFEFLRALKESLDKNKGTIFRYAAHENTVLNDIFHQLQESNELDKNELIDFIQDISKSSGSNTTDWEGERNMFDLCGDFVKAYYLTTKTNGSSSLKYILPTIVEESEFLREKYSQPISKLNLTSKNFSQEKIFLKRKKGSIINPYEDLQDIFKDFTPKQMDDLVSGLDSSINNGGMALIAYAKLQFEEMPAEERQAIKNALLKYCELDTLAMVMIYEYFLELVA